ncbi:uncharacterized protein YndB with AHSA1/START domain [Sphingomonas sp. UYAg733]
MTSVTLVRRIRARPETVFEAISTGEGIAHWWGPDAGPVLIAETDVRVGGAFRVRFAMLDGSEHESFGIYLENDPPRRLVMSWQWTDDVDLETRLEMDLREIPEGTELTLTHARLPDTDTVISHEAGWSGSLDKLERYFSTRK